uniref:Uncharacterized protein n=1 Tax=Guillardia theta TaxID=55529 RepID=A0A7S4M1A1_GUITH|mmetsp:Transcript_13130/g.46117  ORF Transcript_13130/g.46117 Transcript_13130/m.46117 type:complete len:369 (+) Transcript_13130:119-1225(+)
MPQERAKENATAGRALPDRSNAEHSQQCYTRVDATEEPRGINGPLFSRQVCGGANMNGPLVNSHNYQPPRAAPYRIPWQVLVGDEQVARAWPGSAAGLNVKLPTPRKKGDLYRSGSHYRSKHDPRLLPTGGTMGLHNTSMIVSNIDGRKTMGIERRSFGFLGRSLGSYRNSPTQFLRSREKTGDLAAPQRFHYPDEDSRLPRPPGRGDKGFLMPRRTAPPNFVLSNQVDCLMGDIKFLSGTLKKSRSKRPKDSPSEADPDWQRLQEERRSDFEAILNGAKLEDRRRVKRLKKIQRMTGSIRSKSQLGEHPGMASNLSATMPARPKTSLGASHIDKTSVSLARTDLRKTADLSRGTTLQGNNSPSFQMW